MSKWKLSIGTAGAVGSRRLKTDALPTTAYVMLGERCSHDCAFCAQARESKAQSRFLSRVSWPETSPEEAARSIGTAYLEKKIKRVCLQVVDSKGSRGEVLDALDALSEYSPLPVVVSCYFSTVEQAEELFARGADRLGLALDAATPELFAEIKGGSWQKRWELLCACAEKFPGRMTTHLIVGLGETEAQMWRVIAECLRLGITVGLFAFTPLKGTRFVDRQPPDVGSYRRLQIAAELRRRGWPESVVALNDERILDIKVPALRNVLSDGRAFRTSGCEDCNRPYYNEKPGTVLYNYHRPLTETELKQAFCESGVATGC